MEKKCLYDKENINSTIKNIYCTGKLGIYNCIFVSCYSVLNGGAIFVESFPNKIEVRECKFFTCSSSETKDGFGAIFCHNCESSIVFDSLCISDCKGTSPGIYALYTGGNILASKITFYKNKGKIYENLFEGISMENMSISCINSTENTFEDALKVLKEEGKGNEIN